MHAYTYLKTCMYQYMALGAVESASPDKSAGTVPVFAASDNNGVDDTDGVPADEDRRGAAPVSGHRSRR
jgi:hypothetical protein